MYLALPDYMNAPTPSSKKSTDMAVTHDVGPKFLLPKGNVGSRRVGIFAFRMPVPEAAVYEHDTPLAGQDNIGPAGNARNMKAEAKSGAKEVSPDDQLRSGICAPDSRHHPTPGYPVNDICHAPAR